MDTVRTLFKARVTRPPAPYHPPAEWDGVSQWGERAFPGCADPAESPFAQAPWRLCL